MADGNPKLEEDKTVSILNRASLNWNSTFLDTTQDSRILTS